jgi:two-component system response regulator YesN
MEHCRNILDLFKLEGCVVNAETEHFAVFLFGSVLQVDDFTHSIINVTLEFLSKIQEKRFWCKNHLIET